MAEIVIAALRTPMDPVKALFANAWIRFRVHFWTLVWIFVVPGVLVIAGQLVTDRNAAGTRAAGTAAAVSGSAVLGGIFSVVGSVISILATIALVNAVARGTNFAASYRVGLKLFWVAIWISILEVVAVIGGTVLLVVPGIVMAIALLFATYALVIEDKRGVHALRQSRAYVKGHWWAVVGRELIVLAILVAAMAIIYSPTLALGGVVAGGVVYLVILVCFTAFSVAYTYEMYENLRRIAAAAPAGTAAGSASVAAIPAGAAAAKPKSDFLSVCLVVGVVALIIIALLILGSAFGKAW